MMIGLIDDTCTLTFKDTSNNMPRILLGICGGIAAYKAAELARLLIKAGAEVRVVMTSNACQFITPLTLQALTQHPVAIDLVDERAETTMPHIELARWPECIVIAPASADTIAKISHGFADDLLSTLCLATRAPIVIAPAMNQAMWLHAATQHNIQTLKDRGLHIIHPDDGSQACGEIGPGRLPEPASIASFCLEKCFSSKHPTNGMLHKQKWVITAGPTREAIDPARFLSNHSSGKMGYALAAAAASAGAEVLLISGPTLLATPINVHCVQITTAEQMLQACLVHALDCDVFIGAAAVADFTPQTVSTQKIKKSAAAMTLSLMPTQDILLAVKKHCHPHFLVGFAAETQNIIEHARNKLQSKQLDLIVANDISRQDSGFNADNNQVIIIDQHAHIVLPLIPKVQLALELITLIHERAQIKPYAKE